MLKKKEKLFAAFIDFERAFDTIWRDGLWFKLLTLHINGKMYNVIIHSYENIKSNIVYNSNVSDYFMCNKGVRQGENLSPILFALYLNDLEHFLEDKSLRGLESISEEMESKLQIYLKMFVILYADDTVLLAESADDLQKQLDYFNE